MTFPGPDATFEQVKAWERETYYDREIAPRLVEVARLCEAQGMSIVASVEYNPDKRGSTISEVEFAGLAQQIVRWATLADRNVDTLIGALVTHARLHGHSSIFMARLGVPEKPESK